MGQVTHKAYSSMQAFLAHYHALRRREGASSDERAMLASMEKVLDVLRPEERLALDSDSNDPLVVRHRERALLRLGRELRIRKVLEG